MFWSGIVVGLFLGASFGFILSAFFFARIESHDDTPLNEQYNNLAADKFSNHLRDVSLTCEDLNVYN